MKYEKKPLTYREQIELLEKRGVKFIDEDKAEYQLSNVSYFRLISYMYPFRKNENGVIIEEFKYGTTWKDIYNLYAFDRKLRLLVFDAIEKIEVSLRTKIVYHLSHKYGAHWQDNPDIFVPSHSFSDRSGSFHILDVYGNIQKHIQEQLNNACAEVFIENYRKNYDNPINPPSWMCVEVMYLNQLSRICSNLRNRNDIVTIAKEYGLPPKEFISWVHTTNYVRNLCAHHSRLWNREFKIVPAKLSFTKSKKWISNAESVQRKKVYYYLCIVNYMLQTVNPTSSFVYRLKELIHRYNPDLSAMGFPKNWENEKIW